MLFVIKLQKLKKAGFVLPSFAKKWTHQNVGNSSKGLWGINGYFLRWRTSYQSYYSSPGPPLSNMARVWVKFPILGKTIDRGIRKRLEHERSRRGNTRHSPVFFPEFSSRFLSALQQKRTEYSLERLLYLFCDKEAVKFLRYYFLLNIQTKLLADGVTA